MREMTVPRSAGYPKPKANSAEIKLLGQRIALKCSETDPELVDETIQLVSMLLRNAELRSKGVAAHQIAILALLDLAGEYVKAKRRTTTYKRQMDQKSQELLKLFEAET